MAHERQKRRYIFWDRDEAQQSKMTRVYQLSDYAHSRNTSFCGFCERTETEAFHSVSLHRSNNVLKTPAFCILFLSYYLALTLLSSRLSKGPGGSSRQRNSLTARLYQIKESELLEVQNQQQHLIMITKWRYFFS